MKTRRPNMLMFNDWMRECVKHLERSPIPVDRHMAAWFELQKITDEAMASFGLDDTSSTAPLTESRVQAVLRWFDNRMQSWKNNIPTEMFNGTSSPCQRKSENMTDTILSAIDSRLPPY